MHRMGSTVYHRQRILLTSTLSCMKEKEEITETPGGAWAPAYQERNKGAPSPTGARPSCKGRALLQRGALHKPPAPFHLSILQPNFPPPPHMAWNLPHLPAPSADPSSPPIPRPWVDHIPLHPFWHGILYCGLVASVPSSNNITSGHYES